MGSVRDREAFKSNCSAEGRASSSEWNGSRELPMLRRRIRKLGANEEASSLVCRRFGRGYGDSTRYGQRCGPVRQGHLRVGMGTGIAGSGDVAADQGAVPAG